MNNTLVSTPPFEALKRSTADVNQLRQFHSILTGTSRGRRYDVDVLNRSGVVLAVAAWESFIEDLARAAFAELLAKATSADRVPVEVRLLASEPLRAAKDARRVWALSGEGWRIILHDYVESQLNTFHSPRPANVNLLFERVLALPNLSTHWSWHKVSSREAAAEINRLIDLRGKIAHRLAADRYVPKQEVKRAVDVFLRAAAVSQNHVKAHLKALEVPVEWPTAGHGSAA